MTMIKLFCPVCHEFHKQLIDCPEWPKNINDLVKERCENEECPPALHRGAGTLCYNNDRGCKQCWSDYLERIADAAE